MRISDWSSDVCSSDLRFLRPSELAHALRGTSLQIEEVTGVAYNPPTDAWRLAPRDLDVNYMMLAVRSEEHTSELQSLMRISYAVFCLKKKNTAVTKSLQSDVYI